MINLEYLSNVVINGSIVITDTYNYNHTITLKQVENSPTCLLSFSNKTTIVSCASFIDAMRQIERHLDESYSLWEIDQRELSDMEH